MASEIIGSFAFRKTGDDGSVTTVITEFWSPDRYGVCYATYTTYSVPVPGSAKAQRIAAGLDRLEPGYSVEKVEGGLSALRDVWSGQLHHNRLNGWERIAVEDAGFEPVRRTRRRIYPA